MPKIPYSDWPRKIKLAYWAHTFINPWAHKLYPGQGGQKTTNWLWRLNNRVSKIWIDFAYPPLP